MAKPEELDGTQRAAILLMSLGEQDAAAKELRTYLNHRTTGKPDDWPSNIGRFLGGQLAESDFLKAAENADGKKQGEQQCEAYFYAGSERLIAGDKTAAADYFKKCVATNKATFFEYHSAVAELKFLAAK